MYCFVRLAAITMLPALLGKRATCRDQSEHAGQGVGGLGGLLCAGLIRNPVNLSYRFQPEAVRARRKGR